ncbi:GtrA family protein [Blastococcus sp. TML/M2B]|uniref:GtrA family protein n=1 Tax=unclassified Blastococcus TaxID=2619396 RepID=UPI00190CD277|nr:MULTISPECIES: GtrA family protein [unclassified Blastococcus]MBN1094165.1 GtrA family protein [Blastococcus sp. TML/M2B]MBN1095717.1 GtrA family protein [Blastococcus sp. TML/C7B]
MTRPSLLRRRVPGRDDAGSQVTQQVPEQVAAPAPWTVRLAERLRQDDTLAQFARFVLVGGSTTLVYALLFIPFQGLGYLAAHLIATVASTVLANEMHRRLTFHAEDRVGWFTAQWEASTVAALGLLATSATLGWIDTTTAEGDVWLQITAVVTVTALIGLMRFIALGWIFRSPAPDRV